MHERHYPRPIHVGMGILMVVHSPQQEWEARLEAARVILWAFGIVTAGVAVLAAWFLWHVFI